MKQLLPLTTFLSSLIMTSVANAEWTKVAENVNGIRLYMSDKDLW